MTICFHSFPFYFPYHFLLFSHMRTWLILAILNFYLDIKVSFWVGWILIYNINSYLAWGSIFLFSSSFSYKGYRGLKIPRKCFPWENVCFLREAIYDVIDWPVIFSYFSILGNILFISVMCIVGNSTFGWLFH